MVGEKKFQDAEPPIPPARGRVLYIIYASKSARFFFFFLTSN